MSIEAIKLVLLLNTLFIGLQHIDKGTGIILQKKITGFAKETRKCIIILYAFDFFPVYFEEMSSKSVPVGVSPSALGVSRCATLDTDGL